jgi:hypothetical protein
MANQLRWRLELIQTKASEMAVLCADLQSLAREIQTNVDEPNVQGPTGGARNIGHVVFNAREGTVWIGGDAVQLTPRQAMVFDEIQRSPGQMATGAQLKAL